MFGFKLGNRRKSEGEDNSMATVYHRSLLEEQQSLGQKLTCRECGAEFLFSIGEQAFFQKNGLRTPARCPACRKRRREQSGRVRW